MSKELVYFQLKGINPKCCEVGMFLYDDDWIYYLHEPCKIHKKEVKIIPEEKVDKSKHDLLLVID